MADELVFGAREAAWPLIRSDLHLGYAQIGLLFAVPDFVAAAVEPAFGLFADAGHRRRLVLSGGVGFVLSMAAFALAPGFLPMLLASVFAYPASGAFVALSQATLLDDHAGTMEGGMARWSLVGSVGALAGPMLLAGAVAVGFGWRGLFVGFAVGMVPLVWLARGIRFDPTGRERRSMSTLVRQALRSARDVEVLRWLALLELHDLMGDVLAGFLALYLVDVAGASPTVGAGSVAIWGAATLTGNALLVPVLERVDGVRYLRFSAWLAGGLYPAFLLVPGVGAKLVLVGALGLVQAGWYTVANARLFAELPGSSGTAVALSSLASSVGRLFPLLIGVVAARAGLGPSMWIPMVAPIALLAWVPRVRSSK